MKTVNDVVAWRTPRRVALGWAFFERQTNLWKRYWAWEAVWLVYGVVNTLAITFIAKEAGRSGLARPSEVPKLVLFLMIGTLTWAYVSAVLDDMSLVIMWERWDLHDSGLARYTPDRNVGVRGRPCHHPDPSHPGVRVAILLPRLSPSIVDSCRVGDRGR